MVPISLQDVYSLHDLESREEVPIDHNKDRVRQDLKDMTRAVQDYVFRGDEVGKYSLYELYMISSSVNMSFEQWNEYQTAIRLDPLSEQPGGHRHSRDRWQTRVLMSTSHPQIDIGEIRATQFHKAEKVPLLIGILGISLYSKYLLICLRAQDSTSRSNWERGMARVLVVVAIQALA